MIPIPRLFATSASSLSLLRTIGLLHYWRRCRLHFSNGFVSFWRCRCTSVMIGAAAKQLPSGPSSEAFARVGVHAENMHPVPYEARFEMEARRTEIIFVMTMNRRRIMRVSGFWSCLLFIVPRIHSFQVFLRLNYILIIVVRPRVPRLMTLNP